MTLGRLAGTPHQRWTSRALARWQAVLSSPAASGSLALALGRRHCLVETLPLPRVRPLPSRLRSSIGSAPRC